MKAQYLDSMDIERERGITIKAQNVRLQYRDHDIFLIDTPGHVDFGYEVSRSLAACDGVILLVDASPGHRGPDAGQLLPGARARPHDRRRAQQDRPSGRRPRPLRGRDRTGPRHPGGGDPAHLGQDRRGRARTARRRDRAHPGADGRSRRAAAGAGVRQLLRPVPRASCPRCGCSTVRCSNGARLRFMQAGDLHDIEEIGLKTPDHTPMAEITTGEVGYLIAGHQERRRSALGRNRSPTRRARPPSPLAGYLEPKPMVFCGLFPIDGDEFENLREALEKLRLNDASFTYEPETSGALGFGFRCGFLGSAAHGDRARAARARVQPVADRHRAVGGVPRARAGRGHRGRQPGGDAARRRDRPHRRADADRSRSSRPSTYTGTLMELCQTRRGEMTRMEYLSPGARRACSTGFRSPRSSWTSSTR